MNSEQYPVSGTPEVFDIPIRVEMIFPTWEESIHAIPPIAAENVRLFLEHWKRNSPFGVSEKTLQVTLTTEPYSDQYAGLIPRKVMKVSADLVAE